MKVSLKMMRQVQRHSRRTDPKGFQELVLLPSPDTRRRFLKVEARVTLTVPQTRLTGLLCRVDGVVVGVRMGWWRGGGRGGRSHFWLFASFELREVPLCVYSAVTRVTNILQRSSESNVEGSPVLREARLTA